MMKSEWRAYVRVGGLIVLGGVFALAAILKGSDPAGTAKSISNYKIITEQTPELLYFLAFYMPALELACVFGLCVPGLRVGALGLISVMLAFFTLLLLFAWGINLDVSCGCFGSSDTTMDYPLSVTRNALLFLIANWLYFGEPVDA